MQNDSPTPSPSRENFSVFEFALVQLLPGPPRQSVKLVGEFPSVEDAFTVSLARARREATILTQAFAGLPATGTGEPPITILATEWGYDVRHEHQTVTRFWIHPQAGMTD